jgi:deazaflavin-dependent oxidoreductase (nitroreductase family)
MSAGSGQYATGREVTVSETGEDTENDASIQRLAALVGEQFAYLTTTGRISGRPHRIEIWFAVDAGRVYLLSEGGEQSDWVKNLRQTPDVLIRIGAVTFTGRAHVPVVRDDDLLARRLLVTKYEGWRAGEPLSDWARTATPVVEIAGVVEA